MRKITEINSEVKILEDYRSKIPAGILTDNRAAIEAQILVLTEKLLQDDIYDRWPDEQGSEIRCNALDAFDWMAGEKAESPSSEWKELVDTSTQASLKH